MSITSGDQPRNHRYNGNSGTSGRCVCGAWSHDPVHTEQRLSGVRTPNTKLVVGPT